MTKLERDCDFAYKEETFSLLLRELEFRLRILYKKRVIMEACQIRSKMEIVVSGQAVFFDSCRLWIILIHNPYNIWYKLLKLCGTTPILNNSTLLRTNGADRTLKAWVSRGQRIVMIEAGSCSVSALKGPYVARSFNSSNNIDDQNHILNMRWILTFLETASKIRCYGIYH